MVRNGTLNEELRDIPSQFEEYLARFFRQNAERYAYGPLFEPIYQDLSSFVLRRGKRIRPLLFLASYRIFGGQLPLNSLPTLQAAASLELLHTFILIHD